MTKVDPEAEVPPVDAAARARLADALDRAPVVAAYLFGSQASGAAGPLSDVDVAVVTASPAPASPGVAPRGELRAQLRATAAGALGTEEVDLVLLDGAPPLLCHRVLRGGVLLLDRNPRERVRFETRALLDYLDTAPLRETLAAGRRERLVEGRFGRR
ncbi:MAG: type VII toxin-antitoxin system MntA family adenylyltransferase antitoxin [Thermoleophilaceae bacterium]